MSPAKKILALILSLAALLTLSGCSKQKAECSIVSMELVDSIPAGHVTYSFEKNDVYKIVLNAKLSEKFTADGAKGDEFRKAMYNRIKEGCKLTSDGDKASCVWGYWPKSASADSASEMTLFYCVPKGAAASGLTFTLDGSVLGDPKYQFTYKP